MKKATILIALISIISTTAFAQDNEKKGFWADVNVFTGDCLTFDVHSDKSMDKVGTEYDHVTLGADAAFGYRFNPYIALGAGAGISGQIKRSGVNIPVFIRARYDMLNRFASPYISIDLGYSIPSKKEPPMERIPYGIYSSGTLGVSFRVEKGQRIGFGINSGIILNTKVNMFSVPVQARLSYTF